LKNTKEIISGSLEDTAKKNTNLFPKLVENLIRTIVIKILLKHGKEEQEDLLK